MPLDYFGDEVFESYIQGLARPASTLFLKFGGIDMDLSCGVHFKANVTFSSISWPEQTPSTILAPVCYDYRHLANQSTSQENHVSLLEIQLDTWDFFHDDTLYPEDAAWINTPSFPGGKELAPQGFG